MFNLIEYLKFVEVKVKRRIYTCQRTTWSSSYIIILIGIVGPMFSTQKHVTLVIYFVVVFLFFVLLLTKCVKGQPQVWSYTLT